MRRPTPTFLAVLYALHIPCVAGAFEKESVAMFRGNPQLTGVYDAKPLYTMSGIRFRFETGGPIRGTPAVVDGRVYVGSGDGYFYAVDAHTGKERWKFKTAGAVHSSAAVARGCVYFASRDGYLYALAAEDGTQRWKFFLGKDLGSQNYWDYFLSSPSVLGQTLYIGSGNGNLYAINMLTGKSIWKFDAHSRIRSTPAVTDDAVIFGTMSGHVYALQRADGKLRWKFATQGASNNFANAGNDTTSIFSSASIGNGIVTIGARDSYLYALDVRSGKLLWRITHDESSWILATAIADGHLYVGSGSALIVQAADLRTGAEIWRFKTRAAVFSSLTVVGDLLYFADFTGNVIALDRATGTERWRFPMGSRSLSTPVVAEGVVYCSSDDGVLYALDGLRTRVTEPPQAKTHAVYWEGPKSSDAFSWFANNVDVTIRNYFVASGYELLNAEQLGQLMQRQIGSHTRSVIVFADNRIPASVVETDTDQALIRRYLEAGGEMVLLGVNPLAYRGDPITGVVETVDFSVPRKVFGINYSEPNLNGGYYGAHITAEGGRWGLHGFSVGSSVLEPRDATVVLADDEYGMASSWEKNFGGPAGGALLQLNVPRAVPADLSQYYAAVEHLLNR